MSKSNDDAAKYQDAIWRQDESVIRELITQGVNIEARDGDGRTPLTNAVINGSLKIMKLLLEKGADPNSSDRNSFTPLHFAVNDHKVEAAELLIAHGARVNCQDAHGNSPLISAVFASQGRGELILLLRKHGADHNLANHSGVTAFSLAQTIGNFNVRQFFQDVT